MLFLEIMSWKGDSRSNGGRLFFRWGASSLIGGRGVPWGASVLMGVFKKIVGWDREESGPHAPTSFLNKNKSAID